MVKRIVIFILCFVATNDVIAQQQPLPVIAAKNIGNKIIISWVNEFTKPITTLNIQRSFDSLKNYKTIGSVLSPQSTENGYADVNPPYNRMYYRVFIAFEGGSYMYSDIRRPSKDTSKNVVAIEEKFPWQVVDTTVIMPSKNNITYPSSTIFTAKDNNVIIHLQDAATKHYSVKFYDEAEKFLFELKKIKEDYLIIEKVNFIRFGWFRFELFENGELIEDNKFQIIKDPKKL